MSASQLDSYLPIEDGKLTLTAETLPGSRLGDLLDAYNGGMPLVIDGAEKESTAERVTVTGTASFMKVPGLPVTGVFTMDESGTPTATLRFALIGDTAGPDSWRFSQSFPTLPIFPDTKTDSDTQPQFLDTLLLSNCDFVLTTFEESADEATGVALVFGLNFVGRLQPTGMLGLFGTLLSADSQVTLFGSIVMPLSTQLTLPLPPKVYPWQADWAVPGINLQADLGVDLRIADSSLLFHDMLLRIYSPESSAWLEANSTYVPTTAVTGSLDVPSAGISVALTARVLQNYVGVTLSGTFEGVTLENLARLLDLANGDDLFDYLPEDIKEYGEALGGLSLEAVGLSFANSFSPTAVYITVGMPNVNTNVLSYFTVKSVFATFVVAQAFTANRAVGLILGGSMDVAGAPFDVSIDMSTVSARATLKEDVLLPLGDLFEEVGLPAPADLSIDTMELAVAPGQGYSFDTLMADDPPWELDLGPVPMLISGVILELDKPDSGSATGAFGGTLEFADNLIISMNYELPGSFTIRAEFAEVKLSQLVARLNEIGLDLPTGFDIDFQQSYVLIAEQSGGLTFSVATEIEGFGLLAFTAEKQGQWGFAFGLDLEASSLSAIPGLEGLAAFESFVGLTTIMLVVSSLSQTGFMFPDMANFNAPPLQGKSMSLPPQASGLVSGMNVYAALDTGKNEAFRALAQYLGVLLDGTVGITLGVSLPDPATNSKLFLSLNEEIQKGILLAGEFGLLMQGGEVGLFLTADVKTQVQGQPMEFKVTAVALANGVLVSGTMLGTIKFDPVQLSNLALVIGIDFEAIPSLGIAATVDVANFDSSVAIFFDSTDPAKSMFSGAVSNLSLRDVAESIAGQGGIPTELDDVLGAVGLKGLSAFDMPVSVAESLDNRDLGAISAAFRQYGGIAIPSTSDRILLVINTAGSVWHLTDMSTMLHYALDRQGDTIAVSLQPQFYCAPEVTYVGSIQFPQALYVMAEIDYLVLQEQIKVLISPSKGIAIDLDSAPIVIYKRNYFAVTGAGGEGGPHLSLSTYNQPELTDPQLRTPHFLLSGSVRLLGVEVAGAYVFVNYGGLQFQLFAQVDPVLNLSVSGTFDSFTNLQVGGSAVVGVSGKLDLGDLGTMDVDVKVTGSLDVGYKGEAASATFKGSFEFPGVKDTCVIPPLSLDVDGAALQNIADTLWTQVSDILNKLVKDADQWLTWLADGMIKGAGETAEEVGRLLDQVYGVTDQEVAEKTQQILNYTSDQVAEALKGAGATADEAVAIMEDMGYEAEEISSAIASVFTGEDLNINFGHVDTPAGPHLDVPKSHLDTPKVYTDTTSHWDVPKVHTDFKTGWHNDVKTPHSDSKSHTDQTITPHGDTAAPHTDTQTPPHGDTQTHIDT